MAEGTDQTPSPAIKADATIGADMNASAGAKYCQIARKTEPMAMSTVKYAPTKAGIPSILGMGTSFTHTDSNPNLCRGSMFV